MPEGVTIGTATGHVNAVSLVAGEPIAQTLTDAWRSHVPAHLERCGAVRATRSTSSHPQPHGTGGIPAWEQHMTVPTAPPAAPEPPATPPPPEAQPPAQAKPETDWKAEARKHEARAKENAAAAAELALLKESQKTEAQKLADRATQAEKERDEARLEALRVKVGAAKKLPADVVDLLKGATEEELAAHADRLAEHFKASVRPSGSADQGPRGTAPPAGPAKEFADFLQGQLRQ